MGNKRCLVGVVCFKSRVNEDLIKLSFFLRDWDEISVYFVSYVLIVYIYLCVFIYCFN